MDERGPTASAIHDLLPAGIEGCEVLAELALDVRWSWNHGADHIWKQLDNDSWELTRSPWLVLQSVARERIVPHPTGGARWFT
jgi:starch phosphorylase